jgi:hypothetical protein
MSNRLHQLFFVFSSIFLGLTSYGQKGPGGVSLETGSQSTCRAWLDASTLTSLADGDDLTIWQDVSLSAAADNAVPRPGELPPFFRDNAANTINGFPVVTFEDGRFLVLNSTSDLNLESESFSKTVFFAFRTSSDITSKQVLYEEGGCWRGLNIYIDGGQIYCGAYDLNGNGVNNNGGTDPGGTPQWGYSFVSRPIQSNSTYILTMQFYAASAGFLETNPNSNNYYIRGWLNGQVFDVMDFGSGDLTNNNGNNSLFPNGIGSLSAHPDPIGLGAVNSDYVDHDGLDCNNTGANSFKGRLAELCYYNDRLTESERIIIENYLGAKYFANIIVNDKYDHQAGYGNEVIGIGQQTTVPGNNHNLSQGRNPFLVSKRFAYTSADQFFFTGHNGANLSYTDQDVPNNSSNIQRLQRVWRVDHRSSIGSFGAIDIEVDISDLPAAPSGFSKLVLLVDETSVNFPNFSLGSTEVVEIPQDAGSIYITDYNFPDNSFFTLGWVRPEVSFDLIEASGIEGDSPPLPTSSPFFVTASLNYTPASGNLTVDYKFIDGSISSLTAEAADYEYDPAVQSAGLTFSAPQKTAVIPFSIVNDNIADDESTEEFQIILENGSNTSPGLFIGTKDTLTFSILDDDPPPTGSFDVSAANVIENGIEFYIKVRRTGDPTAMASTPSTVRIQRVSPPNQGSADYGIDFQLNNADNWSNPSWAGANPTWRRNFVTFPAAAVSSQLDSVRVEILDDEIDENNETIVFNLFPENEIAVDPSSITTMVITITDDDPLPVANFVTDNQTGYESVGDPVIFVELDRPSTRDVEVTYEITGGTATFGQDYTGAINGVMLFPPGDTLAFPNPFNVDNGDLNNEPDETVIFQLITGINATIGTINEHTYTIVDYAPFEWKGAGGIGRDSDNIVWINADRMGGTGLQNSINNFSPRDIDINRANGNNNRANLQDNVINGRKALYFDGNPNTSNADMYEIDNSSFTNIAGFVERKAYFLVMQVDGTGGIPVGTGSNPTTTNARLIYEQGGGTRGISIYLYQSKLYFHAWNDANDGPQSPWGFNGNTSSSTYAESSQTISANVPYVISCIYDNFSNEPLQVYVNGVKGVMSSTITSNPLNNIGRLYSHAGAIGLGAVNDNTRFHFTTSIGSERQAAFRGWIAEFIKFHEPQMNETRRILLENYLSAKYNIPLDNSDTRQVFDLTYASGSETYNNEVAGVGRTNSQDIHGDSQGPLSTAMRVRNPIFANANGSGFLTWGHNGEQLTNTYPFSAPNAANPANILERSGKVWRINESSENNINSADILINFSESDSAVGLSADNSLLKLLVTNDPNDWSTASVYDVNIKSGFIAEFQNVTMNDGIYVALGNTSNYFNTPLPIELVSFDAKLNGAVVDLDWTTASELNNDYFVVERAGNDLIWEPIMTVVGAGTSNSVLRYSEVDRNPLKGLSYYRLKQVDFDGQFSYSEPVAIMVNEFKIDEEFVLFPNPSKEGFVFIRPPKIESGYLSTIRLFDATGKLLSSEVYDQLTDVYQFNYGELTPGIYIIQVSGDEQVETKKFVIE